MIIAIAQLIKLNSNLNQMMIKIQKLILQEFDNKILHYSRYRNTCTVTYIVFIKMDFADIKNLIKESKKSQDNVRGYL